MKMKTLLVAALCIAGTATIAHAHRSKSVRAIIGFNAEAAMEDGEAKSGGQTQEFKDDDSDLKSNMGVVFTMDMAGDQKMPIGLRVAAIQAESDESDDDTKFLTLDAGAYVRYFLGSSGKIEPFVSAAAGLTYVMSEADSDSLDDQTGIGYHVVVGGGLEMPFSPTMNFIGSVEYSHQSAAMEGDLKGGFDGTFEYNGTIKRVLISGGVSF